MLFLSDRMTSASGSIGGTTFSHNRFGLYTRARRVPVNPNTAYQQAIRNAFRTASAEWRTLTDAQRAAWNAYAAGSPTTNRLGQTVYLTGQQWYTATLSLTSLLSGSTSSDAPTTFGRIELGTPTIILDASGFTAVLGGLNTDLNGSKLGLFLGNAISAGRSFYKGPYQLVGSGDVAAGALTLNAIAGRNGTVLAEDDIIPYRIAGIDEGSAVPTNKLTTIATGLTVVVA